MSRILAILALISLAGSGAVLAQVPGEVQSVAFADATTLDWQPTPDADVYHVYRGGLESPAVSGRCHRSDLAGTSATTEPVPDPGDGYFYLVTAESSAGGEGSPGNGTRGAGRNLLGSCGAMMQSHALNRLGFGADEWTAQRVETLGLPGYVAEQLDPASIDEATNLELISALGPIDPPVDIFQLIQQQVVRGVYSRRQLEQQVAAFFANHFNTHWQKLADIYRNVFPPCDDPPQSGCDPNFPFEAYRAAADLQYREMQAFRALAFGGNFRQMIEASALSPAMILYLDTYLSVVGSPNENFPRELMELHTMGVDGGYTQQDVQELSRIITGWTVCKKSTSHGQPTPLAACVGFGDPGDWFATFVTAWHDCAPKTLFAGTPQEETFVSTCGDPAAQVNELYQALDAIAAHPATARYVSTKILQRFVTDQPTQAMIDSLVAVWNDPLNPDGIGDMHAVLTAALTSAEFLDPDLAGSKIKTPLEHAVSSLRGVRGETDGLTRVLEFLAAAQHIPHYNPTPTGWPEDGPSWVDTNNTLERRNFGYALMVAATPGFGSDVIGLLNDNGVSTAPGNATAIVQYFSDAFFGGALTPAEFGAAVDYLNTDTSGVPTPYNDQRIRDMVSVLLGYPHFQEQ